MHRNHGCAGCWRTPHKKLGIQWHRKGVASRMAPSPSWLDLITNQHITKWALLDLHVYCSFLHWYNRETVASSFVNAKWAWFLGKSGRDWKFSHTLCLSSASHYWNIFLCHCNVCHSVAEFSSVVNEVLPSSLGHYSILLISRDLLAKGSDHGDDSGAVYVSQYRHAIIGTDSGTV